MFNINKIKKTLLLVLLVSSGIMSTNIQSAELWGDPMGVQKLRLYSAALHNYEGALKVGNTPHEPIFSSYLTSIYHSAISISKQGFAGVNKADIPLAQKDRSGVSYIELARLGGGLVPKAVAVPTDFGHLYINVEALSLTKDDSAFANTSYERSGGLSWLEVDAVTSANHYPQFENVERTTNFTSTGTTKIDHGGKWVGFTSIEFGTADNVKLTTTICDIPTDPHEIKLKIFEYGIFVGTWRARYALVPESCQAGQIKAVAVSNVEPFTTLTDVVDFK